MRSDSIIQTLISCASRRIFFHMSNKRKKPLEGEQIVEDENIRVAPTEAPFRRSEKIEKNTVAREKASRYVIIIFLNYSNTLLKQN